VSKGTKKASDDESSPEAPCALGAPLAWLFLIGLRPRRARLRFTKHNKHRTSAMVTLEKITNSGLDTRAVMGDTFSPWRVPASHRAALYSGIGHVAYMTPAGNHQ